MREAVGELFDPAGDLDFLEEGQRPAKIADLASALLRSVSICSGVNTESPEHPPFALALEPGVELLQAAVVLETPKIRLRPVRAK